MLTVCAWCPKTDAEQYANANGEPVSHGICEDHYQELMEGVQGQSSQRPEAACSLARANNEGAPVV